MLIFGQGGQSGRGGAADVDDGLIFDVTDADFMARVVEASRERPIIVDFWAPWCGPCKTLGPALEEVVRKAKGKVALAKMDIDQHPGVASQLRVQSIPTVYAFHNGQPVDGFMGALPTSQLQQFVDKLLKLSGANDDVDAILDAAEAALAGGAVTDAAQAFAAVAQADPSEVRAIAGLARCYAAMGEVDQARGTLEAAPAEAANDPVIASARVAIDLAEDAKGAGGRVAANRATLAERADDLEARFDLALGLVALGDKEGAVSELLEVFRRDREWRDGAAKAQLMKLFDAFGATDPVAISGRRRLSSMIFA